MMMSPFQRPFVLSLAAIAVWSCTARAQPSPSPADASIYATRIDKAYRLLGNDLLVVRSAWGPASDVAFAFGQDPNFAYFTGNRSLLGAVLVLDGGSKRAEVFLPAALPANLRFFAPGQPAPDATDAHDLHVDRVSDWSALGAYIDARLAAEPRPTIRVDDGGGASDVLGNLGLPLDSAAAVANPYRLWLRAVRQRWPTARVVSDRSVEISLRSVKDPSEIDILRRVATTTVAAFDAGLGRFAPGQRQRAVEAAVVEACVRLGDGPSFWPWAMTGPNAVFPIPFTALADDRHLDRPMLAGELARFDIGCAVDQYMGDVGRTVPVSGTFSSEQREVVDLLVEAYRAGLGVLRDGVTGDSVVRASVAAVARRQTSLRTPLARDAAALIARPGGIPYWQLHGVGLRSAETLPDTLRTGMVLDYEPMFAVGGQGFYMEDMILVTRDGYEILTKGLPYTATEIEGAMRRASRRAGTDLPVAPDPRLQRTPGLVVRNDPGGGAVPHR